jgi:hypothetical protein
MTERPSSLSRVDFDHLIARAIKLDDEGNERIDLDRARAIAEDLGISASAWDSALRERESLAPPPGAREVVRQLRGRSSIIALAGLVAGGLSGALAGSSAEGVVLLGGAAIAAGVALVVDGIRRRSARSAQVDLAAWWLSVPAGIMLGMMGTHPDPLLFAAASWAGCASLGFLLDRWRHRAPSQPRSV